MHLVHVAFEPTSLSVVKAKVAPTQTNPWLCLQFWSAYVPCQTQDRDALRLTLEQIDLIRRMCASYSELELVTSVQVKWTYSGYWGMVEVTTLAPENNHLTYAYSSEQHPEIGLPHWCGGWPFTRQ